MANPEPKQFIFESYSFDHETLTLELRYGFDGERTFIEKTVFDAAIDGYNREVLDRVGFYLFILAGVSYYKSFPRAQFVIAQGGLTSAQAEFFNLLYQGGLSQFLYENNLRPKDLSSFSSTRANPEPRVEYAGEGMLLMQSGGKDSLLAAELLKRNNHDFVSWYLSTDGSYPEVIDRVGQPVSVARRKFDHDGVKQSWAEGGLNGHTPFSAILAGYGLMAAVLQNKALVIAANESSADEANVEVDGFVVNHQFSKTYGVELAIQDYLHQNIAPQLNYGSILRPINELKVAELFSKYAWPKYKFEFSSCNLANYKQGHDTSKLKWDGTCPKCANAFLLLTPFVDKSELLSLFNGKNLLQSPDMTETYKQLLDLSDIKPFECVGTFAEMQEAYHMAHERDQDFVLPGIDVPQPGLDYHEIHEHQPLFDRLIDYSKL